MNFRNHFCDIYTWLSLHLKLSALCCCLTVIFTRVLFVFENRNSTYYFNQCVATFYSLFDDFIDVITYGACLKTGTLNIALFPLYFSSPPFPVPYTFLSYPTRPNFSLFLQLQFQLPKPTFYFLLSFPYPLSHHFLSYPLLGAKPIL